MKKMKSILALILALVMALSLVACGGGNEDGDKDGNEKMKIALVLPGKKDDVSFNQAMYRGAVEYAEKHADTVELKVVEGVYEVADIDPTLREYADNGYDVVIGPVANDQTMPTLTLFLDGFITADMAIRTLLPQKLKDQYACKTAAALSLLDTLWTRPL